MTAPQEKPTPFSRDEAKQISAIRKYLGKSTHPYAHVLNNQLRKFAKGNAEDKAALRPQIEKSIEKIKASRAGR